MGLQHRLIRWCVQLGGTVMVSILGVILNAGMFAKLEARRVKRRCRCHESISESTYQI